MTYYYWADQHPNLYEAICEIMADKIGLQKCKEGRLSYADLDTDEQAQILAARIKDKKDSAEYFDSMYDPHDKFKICDNLAALVRNKDFAEIFRKSVIEAMEVNDAEHIHDAFNQLSNQFISSTCPWLLGRDERAEMSSYNRERYEVLKSMNREFC